jgi:nitrogen-specific signal transduction histidine kinase
MTEALPIVLLASADPALRETVGAALADRARLAFAESWPEAVRRAEEDDPAAAIVDARCDPVYRRLDEWMRRYPDLPVIVAGPSRAERLRLVDHLDILAVIEPDAGFREWQRIVRLAGRERVLRREMEALRRAAEPPPPPPAPAEAPAERATRSAVGNIACAFRHFEDVDRMLDRAVEGLSAAVSASRAGLFARDEADGLFRLRAGLRFPADAADWRVRPDDPLVRWLEQNARLISRAGAARLEPEESAMIHRRLDRAGADVIAPLQGRRGLLGWLFVGCRSTGAPYHEAELEEIYTAANCLSMLLENALLFREAAIQTSRAEALLDALPTGIVAVDRQGVVRWFSTAAEQMLNVGADEVVGKAVEALGGRLADAVRRALEAGDVPAETPWEDPVSKRLLQIDVRRIGGAADLLGAVAALHDLTAGRRLRERQEELERSAFWNDLAAGLSHEIRNPLVAINTFAQLLPERYEDDDFRHEFSELVAREVQRLEGIIDQINRFAHPPEPDRSPVDVRHSLRRGLARVFPERPDGVEVASRMEGNLPLVCGDATALDECFAHLFQNAREALDGRDGSALTYSARVRKADDGAPRVEVVIEDNGPGVPADDVGKLFSPFFTTKPRGMGLGLPIVRRTVIDHSGRLDLTSDANGTRVVIELPALDPAAEGAAR